MGDLWEADPVAEVLRAVTANASTVGVPGPEHVSGQIEGPWPHIVVAPGPGGDLRDAMAVIEPDVLLEVIGPADGSIGPAALWRIAMKCIVLVKGLTEQPTEPGRAVISGVRFTGGLTKQPLASGQTRWQVTLSVAISPPNG
jgi:hypothetical protein